MTTPPEECRVPEIGSEAPDFELAGYPGQRRRLSELRGAPVLLAFHPSHWDPSWAECVRMYNRILDFPAICLDTGPIARRYGVADGAAVFVIDGAGRVSWRHTVGVAPPSPNEVAEALSACLPTSAAADSGGWSRRHFVATVVAATASSHFVVTKEVIRGRTYSQLREISGKGRQEEIARMLGGKSESALKLAASLLRHST